MIMDGTSAFSSCGPGGALFAALRRQYCADVDRGGGMQGAWSPVALVVRVAGLAFTVSALRT